MLKETSLGEVRGRLEEGYSLTRLERAVVRGLEPVFIRLVPPAGAEPAGSGDPSDGCFG